jgi:predicted membrane protein
MIGSGFLLNLAINGLYGASSALTGFREGWTDAGVFLQHQTSALTILTLVLLSLFIYILGASIIGRSVRFKKVFHSTDDMQNGILFAFLLIAAGALMICFNTALLNPVWKPFFLSWQMLLFVLGAICICRSHFIWGILLAATGKFFLIEKAAALFPNEIPFEHFTATYWPVIFIIVGVVIVLSFFIRPTKCSKAHPKGQHWMNDCQTDNNENNDGKINYRFVFSGTEQVILDPVFKGGTIETVFAGLELDLRRTSLAEGKTYLYVTAVFGGVEITAPDNWDIELSSVSFFGGINDSRKKHADIDHSRKLIIVGKTTFGGITVK